MAPIPGETKVWQYVTLMKRIYLIDCPGIVPPSSTDTPTDLVLRGVVRVEKVEHPEQYISALLSRVKQHHMEKTYDVKGWQNATELLELLARKAGRLLRGGEPDLDGVAKMMLNDFMRGKIPWYTPVPRSAGDDEEASGSINGRGGKLGEMPRKRPASETLDNAAEDEAKAEAPAEKADGDESSDNEDFEAFDSDTEEALSRQLSFGATSGAQSDDESNSDDVLAIDDLSDDEGQGEAAPVAQISAKAGRPNKRQRR